MLTVINVERDIAIINLTLSKDIISKGYSTSINVTIANQGELTETFNVTVYANASVIGTQNVALNPGENTTLTFTWNTTGFTYGNYTISATADTVSGESDVGDNTAIDGRILVTIPGDINGDRLVNAEDAVKLGAAFGSNSSDPSYDPDADINGDGWVNGKDATILGFHFGESW